MFNPRVGKSSHLLCAVAESMTTFIYFKFTVDCHLSASSVMPRGFLHCLWPSGHIYSKDKEGNLKRYAV